MKTDRYVPHHDRCISLGDLTNRVRQALEGTIILSGKDRSGGAFVGTELFE